LQIFIVHNWDWRMMWPDSQSDFSAAVRAGISERGLWGFTRSLEKHGTGVAPQRCQIDFLAGCRNR
jgi:hypothetical protein